MDKERCKRGQEQSETFYSEVCRRNLVAYDYRTPDGELFSTCKETLQECREARDEWIEKRGTAFRLT